MGEKYAIIFKKNATKKMLPFPGNRFCADFQNGFVE